MQNNPETVNVAFLRSAKLTSFVVFADQFSQNFGRRPEQTLRVDGMVPVLLRVAQTRKPVIADFETKANVDQTVF